MCYVIPVLAQQERIISGSITSQILQRQMKYKILLPEDIADPDKTFPLVYLLHGFGGDENSWLDRCRIQEITDSLFIAGSISPAIYVMPEAGNSYYINNYDGSNRYMDYFITELVPHIDSVFPVLHSSDQKTLFGLSMGGFGAVILALKNPEMFGKVVSLSGAMRTEEMFRSLPMTRYNRYFGDVFGPGLMPSERITNHWTSNSPYHLVNDSTVVNYINITWYIDCGLNDFLLPASEALHRLFLQFDIPHEFHTRPGNHNWEYWEKASIQALLSIQ